MPGVTRFAIVRKVFGWLVLVVLVVTLALILKESPVPNAPTSPSAAISAEQKLDAAAQEAHSGQPAQARLGIVELNSYLAQNLQLAGSGSGRAALTADPSASGEPHGAAGSAPAIAAGPQAIRQSQSTVENVKIGMNGSLVKAYVIFNFHGKDLSLEIDGHLCAQGGYLKFDPTGGKIGSFPLPQSALQAAIEKMMESPDNRDKLRLPSDISNIEVQDGQMVISYR